MMLDQSHFAQPKVKLAIASMGRFARENSADISMMSAVIVADRIEFRCPTPDGRTFGIAAELEAS